MKEIVERIRNNDFEFLQLINAIKTFIISKLDYFMINSVISRIELGKLADSIRKIINEEGESPSLFKNISTPQRDSEVEV
jgi:hypothetical protein